MKKITVLTPSRIHIALIDLNGSIGKIDGGIGLTLSSPGFKITAYAYKKTKISGNDEIIERAERIFDLLQKKCNIGHVKVEIEREIPSHVGLGSGTQLSLGIAQALCKLYGLNYSHEEMAFLVERGGTSGIGVAAFSKGGFIVDGGHSLQEKTSFLPSSASKGVKPPPVIARYDFPDWDILITIPKCRHISGEEEVKLFQTLCPLPLDDAKSIAHIVLLKLMPAIVQRDLISFGEAIDYIQTIGWKKVEIENQGKIVRETMDFLRNNGGYGVGLSSWGPAVFCFGVNLKPLELKIKDSLSDCYCFITKANNTGATIIEEDFNGFYGDRPETADLQEALHR
ncbi:MAG: beta-ribofuranosylaminobenzene 5'-phosphate synthase [bacterium]